MNSINTTIMIGGFVVLFCVVISIFNNSGFLNMLALPFYPIFNALNINVSFIKPIISGIIELTNGINLLSNVTTKSLSTTIILVAFVLGFGGISVLLQVLSIISKSDISIKPYVIGKLLQGIIAAFFTWILIHIFPIFNLDLVTVFSQNVNKVPIQAYSTPCNIFMLILICLVSIFLIQNRKKYKSYH